MASEMPKEVHLETASTTTVADVVAAVKLDCGGALSRGDKASAVKQHGTTTHCRISRCFKKKGVSWLNLEKEIRELSSAEIDGAEESRRIRGFSGFACEEIFSADTADTETAETVKSSCATNAPCSEEGASSWFALERQVLSCAVGLGCTALEESLKTKVETVTCWALIRNIF
jgi:hypothetical protein